MNVEPSSLAKWLAAIGYLIVVLPWIWMAVRTEDCLRFATAHIIPFPKRTIFLIKILAVIVGAGCALGAASQIGLAWYLGLLPAGAIVWLAFTEKVQEIVPSKPAQDAATYESSWQKYWKLRRRYRNTQIGAGAALLFWFGSVLLVNKVSSGAGADVLSLGAVVILVFFTAAAISQWKFFRWPCPRCGCAFNGYWLKRWIWMSARCSYCNLPVEPAPSGSLQNSAVRNAP